MTVLAVLESTLPSVCLSYKIQHNEATMAVLTVLAVSVMTATPLKTQPPFFRDPDQRKCLKNQEHRGTDLENPNLLKSGG